MQSIAKTSEQRKRCFDGIESTIEENEALKGDLARLKGLQQQARDEQSVLQTQNENMALELGRAAQEKKGM